MKLEAFFEKFDEFADAPDAVAKMREVILGLAITGKLLDQKPHEGLASDLIVKATEVRAKLVAEDKLKKPRIVQPVAEFEHSSIPGSWTWTSLGEIAEIGPRNHVEDSTLATFLPMPAIPQQYGGKLNGELRQWSELKKGFTHLADGDIALAKITPCFQNGKSAVIHGLESGVGAGTTELHVARPFSLVVDPYYVWIFLRSPQFLLEGIPHMTGSAGQKRVPAAYFACKPFPLPPRAEQKRIVAKVDELMALCDRLEAQQQERDTRHAALARASLARFADEPTPANLQFLFHKSYDIDTADLRKSIFTLAVQGRLVPQNPNDEPADMLVKRLESSVTPEQQQKQAKALPPLLPIDYPYSVPSGWTWRRFRDVAIIASNLVDPSEFLEFTHLAPDNIEKRNGTLLPCNTVLEDKVRSSNHRFYPGQIIYSKIRPNLAKVVVVDFDGLCSADMYPINPIIDTNYLHRFMLSEPFLVQAVRTDTRVAMPKINQTELNAIAVPVPPLAEQRRIVAKVDQLVALVDELEMRLATSRATAKHLLEAVVAELTAAGASSREVPA